MPQTKSQMKLAEEAKTALLESYDPEAIILFGSVGRGDGDEFSDVDLFLIMETKREPVELGKEMIASIRHITEDIHIVINTPDQYFRERDIPGSIVYSADTEGQILFDKRIWRKKRPLQEAYSKRKQEVLNREYIEKAHGFLKEADLSFREKNFFRCRDATRFAVARVIKGIFVLHGVTPPREPDLIKLYQAAGDIDVDLDCDNKFLEELNGYYPKANDASEFNRMRGLMNEAGGFIKEIVKRYQ